MGIGNVHTLGSLVFTHFGASDFNLDGLTDRQTVTEAQERVAHGAGEVNPSHVHTFSTSPVVPFTCTDLATMLANIPLNGLAIDSGGSAFTSVDAYYTKMQANGARASGSVHFRSRIVFGLVTLGTITLEHKGVASCTGEVHAIFDGSNNPVQFSSNNALPHVAAIDELFTLGKIEINGTELDGVQRINVNFGITAEKLSGGGDLHTTHVNIQEVVPIIEIVGKEVGVLSTYGLAGTAVGANNIVFYAKKYANEGSHVADGTAEHIKFTLTEGLILPTGAGGGQNVSNDGTLRIRPTYDGSNAILQIDTASAIT